jgi:hypothetical protein
MFTPVTDRLIHIHFREVLAFTLKIEGNPIAPLAGFLLADLLLIGLCIWDWRSHKRLNVFPVALLILLLYHISVFTFHRFDFWRSFCDWFVRL